jgi:hypothetical protein
MQPDLQLTPVARAHAAPGVTHLLVVNDGVVDLNLEAEDLRRQRAGRCERGIQATIAFFLDAFRRCRSGQVQTSALACRTM